MIQKPRNPVIPKKTELNCKTVLWSDTLKFEIPFVWKTWILCKQRGTISDTMGMHSCLEMAGIHSLHTWR